MLRAAARTWMRARGAMATRIRGERFVVDPYHIGFWRDAAAGRWEPGSFEALAKHLKPGSTYLDVGAWIGPTVLFAARRCRRVYAFEPDPAAYRFLAWNLELNRLRNVVTFAAALSRDSDVKFLGSPDGRLGTSKSSLHSSDEGGDRVKVPVLGWAEWLRMADPGPIDTMKIDIEGGEFDLLPAMEGYLEDRRPTLLLSIHAPLLEPAVREARLGALLAAIRPYDRAFDESGRPYEPSALRSAALGGFVSLVLPGRSAP